MDALCTVAEPGVGSALKTDVKGKIRMRRGFTDQAVAAGKRQGQGLLGVEAFARSQHVAGEGLVQVTRDGENDGVDVGAVEDAPRVVEHFGAPALCLLDDSLAAQAVLGLGIGDRHDLCTRQLQEHAEQGRAAIADADHSQSHRREIGIGSLADCSLGKSQASGGRATEETPAIQGQGRHGCGNLRESGWPMARLAPSGPGDLYSVYGIQPRIDSQSAGGESRHGQVSALSPVGRLTLPRVSPSIESRPSKIPIDQDQPAGTRIMSTANASRMMVGKVCLVTGASAGIGLVTARELARQGARVIGVGRSAERCAEAARQIREDTRSPAIEYLIADLSSQAEIRRLAGEIQNKTSRLDVLVNNAGGIFLARQETASGREMTFALNHLAYFLLTNLLLDLLRSSAPAQDCERGVGGS